MMTSLQIIMRYNFYFFQQVILEMSIELALSKKFCVTSWGFGQKIYIMRFRNEILRGTETRTTQSLFRLSLI